MQTLNLLATVMIAVPIGCFFLYLGARMIALGWKHTWKEKERKS
jgi:hypothetical protein